MGADQIQLNLGAKFQEIQGFGGAFTDAACYMLNQLAPGVRGQLVHEMFNPSEMGLNFCRVCMGASDYSTKLYSYDDGEADPDLKRFSIEHDREYILPIVREARKENPELFLLATPWSPPGWMKPNNSMLGGSMRKFYLASYAQYFLKFLQAYAAEGVPVQAVTSQNELDTDQDGRMPACIWGRNTKSSSCAIIWDPCWKAQEWRRKSGCWITITICGAECWTCSRKRKYGNIQTL